jgi:hypothetical protein
MARYTFVVLTDAVEGHEDEYNDWYTNRHLSDVLNVDGFVAAQRFCLSETDPPQEFSHKYLALYEVETDDLEKVQRALAETPPDLMPISPALDRPNATARWFTPITDRVTSPHT